MKEKRMPHKPGAVPASLVVSLVVCSPIGAQSAPESSQKPVSVVATPASATMARKTSPYRPVSVTPHAKNYYQAAWGIDNLLVRQTASGNLIRFSYRVTNPEQAKPLGSKEATPYLYGQRSQAVLEVPVMDKVGQLRQTGAQGAGQDYWMVFSNKGNLIKPGDRVDVVIGSFRAVGLMVE